MLVDLARNDLGRVAVPGSIKVDPYRAIERYSHVIHLVSGVSGILEAGSDAFDLFSAAFPAGTVVGAPKIRVGVAAGARTSPAGPLCRDHRLFRAWRDDGPSDRHPHHRHEPGRYTYQAGAGIVADSVPSAEWEEVLSKSGAMRGALETAASGL